jgi:hypothetical protein
MTIERSHGKARPTLPRASDLPAIETARDPSDGRGPGGRFAPGNRISIRQGEKAAVRKLLGRGATDGDVAIVARDSLRLFNGAMRDLPTDGQLVRCLGALYSRHASVSAYFNAKADEAGLASDAAQKLLDVALRHGQRAERLAVTMLDVSTKLAKKTDADTLSADVARAERAAAELEAQHEAERQAARAARGELTP